MIQRKCCNNVHRVLAATLWLSLCCSISLVYGQTTKTVNGAGGVGVNYTTLQAAFAAVNSGAISGQIVLQITGSTIETASAVLNASGTGAANYTSVTIFPTVSGCSISGNSNSPLIDLSGADNVTIDGRVNQSGSANMSLINSNTGTFASSVRFITSAESNTVKYCNIKSSCYSAGVGVINFTSSTIGNGNDNNVIEFCNITNAGGNRPICVVFSSGSSGRENSGNIIRNNNIYDFANANSGSYGINITNNSTDWTISDNSFYETTTIVPSGLTRYLIINVITGNNNLISNNYIGGSGPLCTGSAWTMQASTPHYFCGIYVTGSATASTVSNNTIRNISYTSTEDNPWDGIFINAGNVNVTGNTIGADEGTGSVIVTTPVAVATASISGGVVTSITLLNGGSGYTAPPTVTFSSSGSSESASATAIITGGVVTGFTNLIGGANYTSAPSVIFDGQSNNYSTSHGMIQNSAGIVNISNNKIGSITTVGSSYYSHGFESVYVRPVAATTTFTNNLIGSLTTANSIHVSSPAGSSLLKQDVYGIYSASIGTTVISGNTIANLTNAYAGINSLSRTRGIQTIAGTNTIQNNIVHHIATASGQSTNKVSASVVGISQASTTAGLTQITTGNTVYNISNTHSTATVYVYGIYNSGSASGTASVSGNFVHSLSIASSSLNSEIDGITLNGGVSACANNIVTIGSLVSGGYKIYGIYDEGGAGNTNNSYFNTVYIGGTPSSTSSSTAAFWSNNNTSTRNYRNNILVNVRSGGTAGKHYAIRINGTSSLTIDYNDYFVSGTNGVLGDFGGDKASLASWKTATSQDANSLNVNPGFTTPGGTLPLNYYTTASLPGVAGTGVTTDFAGLTRGVIPKIGALEVNDFVWKGSVGVNGDNFGLASNWVNGVVPPDGSDISFDAAPLNHCLLDQNRNLKHITNTQGAFDLVTNGHQLFISGNLSFSGGAQIDATSSSSIVVLGGTSVQTIPSAYFVSNTINGLTLNNITGFTLNGDLTINQTLTLTAGTLTIGSNTLTLNGVIGTTIGILAGGSSSNLIFGGAGSTTTLPSMTLNNLTINRPNGISLSGPVIVEGTLALLSGTLATGANSLTISGSSPTCIAGNLAADDAAANLIFSNTSAITLPSTFFNSAVNNLTINTSGGVIAGSDITVNGVLNLAAANPTETRGLLEMTIEYTDYPGTSNSVYLNSHVLHMGASATTTGTGDVTGTVKRTAVFAENTAYTFGNQFTTVAFSPGLMPNALSVTITIGTTPAGNPDAVKRTYEIVPTVPDEYTSTSHVSANFHFLNNELTSSISPYYTNTKATMVTMDYDVGGGFGTPDEHGRSAFDFTNNYIGLSNIPISYFINVPGHAWRTIFQLRDFINGYYTWKGSEGEAGSDWGNSVNWNPTGVPSDMSHVIIPDASTTPNDPVLPLSETTINTLRLENGAILTMGSSTLKIKNTLSGGWEDQNPFGNDPGTSTVVFLNPGTTISGNAHFYNVEILDGADITNQVNSSLKISNILSKTGTGKWYTDIYNNTVTYDKPDAQTIIVPDGSSAYRNLILSGSGIKTMPSSALDIHGNFTLVGTASATAAGNMTVAGNFTAGTGTTFSSGDFDHAITGDINCDGTVNGYTGKTMSCNGHFSTNGTFSANGNTLVFNGTSVQTLGGSVSTVLNNLTLNNSSGLLLGNDETVNGTLTWTTGKIFLGDYDLLLGNAATISGYTNTEYAVTDGTGGMQQRVSNNATDVVYPIGTAYEYLPVTVRLTEESTSDNIKTRVIDGLYTSYDGSNIPDGLLITEKVVDKTWILNEETAGGSVAEVQLQWNLADEGTNFDRALSHVARYISGGWVHAGCTAASGISPFTQTLNGISSFGPLGLFGQNIECSLTASEFCAGSSVSVDYSIAGGALNSGNIFTAQLSDVTGGFSSAVDIGSVTATTAGSIYASIPVNSSYGNGYRVRVISSNPSIDGDDNGTDITVNPPSFVPAIRTIASLAATGTAIKWYHDVTGGSPLAGTVELENGHHYFASQTVNGCESTARFEVTAEIDPTPCKPTGSSSQTYASGATVASLEATGSGIRWYSADSGGNALAPSTTLVNGTHYWATQTIDCTESTTRFEVAVTITSGP